MYKWSRLKALIIKEFLAVWRDKKSRIVLILPPLIQLIILSNAATLDVKNVSIGINNQDGGWYSREFIQRIQGSPFFRDVYVWTNGYEAKKALKEQKVLGIVNIQSDFSKLLYEKRHAPIQIMLDGRKLNTSQIVGGYLNRIVERFNKYIVRFWGEKSSTPINLEYRAFFNQNLEYAHYTVVCLIAILAMLLVLTITAMSVSRERENGTFDQLLVSPLQSWEILVGKTVPAMVISIGETTLLMMISLYLFGVPFRGSILLFYTAMIVFLLSIVGVGLFISSLSSTQQQSILGSFLFVIPSIILGGYVTPVENMPYWLQQIASILPITHFFIIIKGILLKDIFASMVWEHIWPMVLSAVCTLSLATWMFKKRLE